MDPSDRSPAFETLETEQAGSGGRTVIPDRPREREVVVIETADRVDPSVAADDAALDRFLDTTDFERSTLLVVRVPVSQSNCYGIEIEDCSLDDDQLGIRASVERRRPEGLDALTVLTCFVRLDRSSLPNAVTVELDGESLDPIV